MNTIKTWPERLGSGHGYEPSDLILALKDEVADLREALKVAQEELTHWKAARKSPAIAYEAAPVAPVKPLNELVEAIADLEQESVTLGWCRAKGHELGKVEAAFAKAKSRVDAALANAKAAQPLTKEQLMCQKCKESKEEIVSCNSRTCPTMAERKK